MDGRFLLPGTVKQGYLTKSPPLDKGTSVFKGWKKRWCILYLSQRELFIQYYENEESARGSSPPKSTVSLRFCEKVDVDLEHSSYKNVFGIHLPERVYYFSAPSNFEMNEWVDAICAHLNLRDQSDISNAYSLSPVPPSTPTATTTHYNTMPTPQQYGSTSPLPVRNVSPVFYPSQYGTLSAAHMGNNTYGTSTTGRGPPPSPPPPYSGNQNFINGADSGSNRVVSSTNIPFPSSPNLSVQQRSLPPIPMFTSDSSFPPPLTTPPYVPPRRSSEQNDNTQEPPEPPPRQRSSIPNFYVST